MVRPECADGWGGGAVMKPLTGFILGMNVGVLLMNIAAMNIAAMNGWLILVSMIGIGFSCWCWKMDVLLAKYE